MYRVFLIDDEVWALVSLERLIPWQEYGFFVESKENSSKTAWEHICENPPQVIVTDIRMPGMSGLELLKKLKENNIKSKVILVSGFADFKYAQEAIRNGAYDYILKPVKKEALTSALLKIKMELEKQKEEPVSNTRYKDAQLKALREEETLVAHSSPSKSVEHILGIIDKTTKDVPTLSEIGRELGLSKSALSQNLKKETGKNYTELLLERRMARARDLLRYSDKTITEIAYETGYSDLFYFSKTFKRHNGMSPNEYRRKMQK